MQASDCFRLVDEYHLRNCCELFNENKIVVPDETCTMLKHDFECCKCVYDKPTV